MNKFFFISIFMTVCNTVNSQNHGGVEQYYYPGNKESSSVVPRIYYTNNKNWYGEVRYNYDESGTFSFNAGRTFSNKGNVSYTITPIAGIVKGTLNGGSLGLNGELEYKDFFFSSESQYTFSSESKTSNFLFNWSELGYQATANIYTGLALQLTRPYKMSNSWEPGCMIGLSISGFTFPLYAFNILTDKKYFVLGINWEWQHRKSKEKNYMLVATNTDIHIQ
jgi:hypothetical protein